MRTTYVEVLNGSKIYLKNDELHREEGPAIEEADGTDWWWYEGQFVNCSSQKEFERYLKLKAFW
jgi:hypothetical protein